jgi:hypothetical protein
LNVLDEDFGPDAVTGSSVHSDPARQRPALSSPPEVHVVGLRLQRLQDGWLCPKVIDVLRLTLPVSAVTRE